MTLENMTNTSSSVHLMNFDILDLLPQNAKITTSSSFGRYLTNLVSLDFSRSRFQLLSIIGFDCFRYTWSLKNLNLGPYIKEIRSGSFFECTSLTRLDLSDCAELEIISFDTFVNAWSLQEIIFGPGITEIRSGAFHNCTSLTRLNLSDCEGLHSINFNMFANAWSLQEIIFGPGITEIRSGAFRNCTSLTRLSFPASITNISWDTFSGCTQLAEVVFEGDTKVDANAFQNCPRLSLRKRYTRFLYGKYSELKESLVRSHREDGICGITLESFLDDSKIVCLPCKHAFFEEPLYKWILKENICPTCRFALQ